MVYRDIHQYLHEEIKKYMNIFDLKWNLLYERCSKKALANILYFYIYQSLWLINKSDVSTLLTGEKSQDSALDEWHM